MTNESILLPDFLFLNISFPTRLCWLQSNAVVALHMCILICLAVSHCLLVILLSGSNRLNDLHELLESTNETSHLWKIIIREGISIMVYVCGTIIYAFLTGFIINDTALIRWFI
jgi:hypothetical protein